MSDAYVGEIRCFGFNFAPVGWFQCNGQLLPIQSYAALFSIIGTYYGGNGTSNFALPNLQGAVPMNWGNGAGLTPTVLGEVLGSTNVTVAAGQLGAHTHLLNSFHGTRTSGTKTNTPSNTAYIGTFDPDSAYGTTSIGQINTPFSPKAFGFAGNGQPHENMQPYLAVGFCICISGIFPPRG